MISAGELNDYITIEKEQTTTGDYGEEITEWVEHVSCWANIKNLSGEEYWDAKSVNSEVTAEIKIRYRDDITADMRVSYNGRIFDIESFFDPYEERKEIRLMVKEQL